MSRIKEGIPHEVVSQMVRKDISRIRSWREHLGLSQKEVAQKMGITQAELSQIESTNSKPRKATLENLTDALGLSVEQLR